MRTSIGEMLVWPTAFIAVFSLYAHSILRVEAVSVTPIIALVVAGLLGAMALVALGEGYYRPGSTALRKFSIFFLLIALCFATISVIWAASDRRLSLNDWGVAAVQLGVPILLILNNWRLKLLAAVAWFCAPFALLDLAANVLDAAGIAHLAKRVGEAGSEFYGLHYLGLAGSSFAEGMVGFVAVVFFADRAARARGLEWFVTAALVAVLLVDLYLAGSRTYIGLGFVSVAVILLQRWVKTPAFFLIIGVAGLFLYKTFTADYANEDDKIRGALILSGLDRIFDSPWVGQGPQYHQSWDMRAGFESLRDWDIAESGALDFAITFGIPAACFWVLSAVCAACAGRRRWTWPAILMAMFTAQMAWCGLIYGLLGSILFYTALTWCQRDEVRGGALAARTWRGAVAST